MEASRRRSWRTAGHCFPRGPSLPEKRSGRLSTPGELHLSLRTIRTGGRSYPVSVQTVVIKGESHTKSNVTKIGGGTALGALIGAVAGGGKGQPLVPELEPQQGQE